MKRLTLTIAFVAAGMVARAAEVRLSGPGLTLMFEHGSGRLALTQMQPAGGTPLLYSDTDGKIPGAGPVGNPLAVVVAEGKYKGVYGASTFKVTSLTSSDRRLLAYLQHDSLPLAMALEITVEGAVVNWSGQAFWNGEEAVDLEIYFPLLSRLRFDTPARDRLLVGKTSGVTLKPMSEINYSESYIGSLSSPVMLAEGGGRGLAIVDDNRAEYAADPGAAALRAQIAGSAFPLNEKPWGRMKLKGGTQGPYAGIRYSRTFRSIRDSGGEVEYGRAEKGGGVLPVRKLGDSVDLGPVRTYAYTGTWKAGAAWLREQRSHLVFRSSPAAWYRDTTFIAEHMGDTMVRDGRSFHDYADVLAEKQRLGADLFHIAGFHDPEILGTSRNWQNRGDYFFAAQNLGGFEAARQGITTLHRKGGRLLYYIEGLIMWRRSRIGRSSGQEWALMNADGSYYEWYKGFWHMCPAVPAWQDWFATTAAEIVRTTGVDGFFVDSLSATDNHRCYNPAHKHPHPDVWMWGVRQMLGKLRVELDKVNPGAIVIVEGETDMAREFADGFISHSHSWNKGDVTEPLLRFLHPDMRAYESWGYDKDPRAAHIWNSVNGYRIYAHSSQTALMEPLSSRTRQYYNAFPEICDNPMSVLDAACGTCQAQVFEGGRPVITVGNATGVEIASVLKVPVQGSVLFDRVSGDRVPIVGGKAVLKLRGWDYRAFEVRP